jgi:pimeloyl-ACP methyl ester carboxylesterase
LAVPRPQPPTFGDIADTSLPLAVLVHGFPDTPYTWRHLGPELAARGYRVVAPWLAGYDAPVGTPISVGTYVRHVLDVGSAHRGDDWSPGYWHICPPRGQNSKSSAG